MIKYCDYWLWYNNLTNENEDDSYKNNLSILEDFLMVL